MYDSFKSQATFYIVYIAESHAVDEWFGETNKSEGVRIAQHTSFNDRLAAARLCEVELGLNIPTVVDGMDNAALEAYAAWPERIYIIGGDGNIHYRGGHGPWEFRPEEARSALAKLLGIKAEVDRPDNTD